MNRKIKKFGSFFTVRISRELSRS